MTGGGVHRDTGAVSRIAFPRLLGLWDTLAGALASRTRYNLLSSASSSLTAFTGLILTAPRSRGTTALWVV